MANDENLKPFTGADDPRRMNGKPKGTVHLSTLIQKLANVDWEKTSLSSKDDLKKKYGKNGIEALVYVAFSKAMSGDTRAMDWLAKHGYGEKLNVEVTDTRKDILSRYGLISEGEDAGKTKEA